MSKGFKIPIRMQNGNANVTMPIIELGAKDFKILEEKDGEKLIPFLKREDREKITMGKAMKIGGSAAFESSIRDELTLAIDHVSQGKFGKAMVDLEKMDLDGMLKALVEIDDTPDELERLKQELTDLIRIAKSFYEYDEKQRQIMDDSMYDQIIALMRAYDWEEPAGIVPNDAKKTSIKYELLHNNMDKAYILRTSDPIPAGVKESDSIENFLRKAYKAMGLDSDQRIRVAVSPKIDGVSVNGTVRGNLLVAPQTRGDESASMKIVGLDGIAITDINPEEEFGIQFECFLTDDDMEAAAEYLGKPDGYANNRNAVAGLINRLCTTEDPNLLPYLSFYPIETEGLNVPYLDRIEYLKGFRIVPTDMIETEVVIGDINELIDEIGRIYSEYERVRGQLTYRIDGAVITIADDENQEILGRKGRTNLYQIALKFDPENATGVVDHIDMDCGRKGYRTPQIYLQEPVVVGGAKYDHVPVLSANLFEQLGLCVGDLINIHRVGDVIPSITVVRHGDGPKLELGGKCPVCGEELVIKNSKLFCKNPNCKNNKVGRMISLFNGIGLDGYSDSFVETLIDKSCGNVSTPGDLTIVNESYLTLIGMTDKVSQAFPARFRAAMQETPDYKIVGSFGIPDLGKERARQLMAYHNGLMSMILAYERSGVKGLELRKALGKIGEKIEEYFVEFPNVPKNIFQELKTLANFGYINKLTVDFSSTLRVGHTGGDLSEEVEELIDQLGYEVTDGSGFDILITASHNSNSGKMQRAAKKGLPIYTQGEFLEQYRQEVA